ncbi:MAG: hypothetical protein FD180_2522 [Planctomycetota bacterium]|nr:MAG: hypothetical protein FD180_2522 [Planctomycetota bacterium]
MTYPNVLVMGYLRKTGQLTPEWQMKLDEALNLGYQRLLTFEVKGGGFDWYGAAPAKTILTAYGILEFTDMAKVRDVDPEIVARAKRVLYERQDRDGAWSLDMPMHTWHSLGNARLPLTAYVVWALREAGLRDAEVERGAAWVAAHATEAADPYVQALVALALGRPSDVQPLEKSAIREGALAHWGASGDGLCGARGFTSDIEATALAALACGRAKSPRAAEALGWLSKNRQPHGDWGSTQATILAIKALLEDGGAAKKPERPVHVKLRVNGREIVGAFREINGETFDLYQQAEIPVAEGENTVELESDGELSASYQVAGRFYLPWHLAPRPEAPPLSIEVAYDKQEIDLDGVLHATAIMTLRGRETSMVIADLGIPPGFEPDASAFERLRETGVIDKYALTGRQITLYFGKVAPDAPIRINYDLRPRFPIEAQSPACGVYEYYAPDNNGVSGPRKVIVRQRK